MLPHFIRHYRKAFPDCNIVVYDNESTDRTAEIARENNCTVITYKTGGKLDDATYLEIKNNCWKQAPTDWVMVVDCDELCDITEKELRAEERRGTTMIRFNGYNMVNLVNDMNFTAITHGVRSTSYDKPALFNKRQIAGINYCPGAHNAAPNGYVQENIKAYNLYHYKYINPDYMVKRHAVFCSRLSDNNKAKGYGGHYQYSEEQIRAEFEQARKQAKRIL